MGKSLTISLVMLFILLSSADAEYYYSVNRQVPLKVDSSKDQILENIGLFG